MIFFRRGIVKYLRRTMGERAKNSAKRDHNITKTVRARAFHTSAFLIFFFILFLVFCLLSCAKCDQNMTKTNTEHGWMDERADGWMDRWISGWVDGVDIA